MVKRPFLFLLLAIFKFYSVKASERENSNYSTVRKFSIVSEETFNTAKTVELYNGKSKKPSKNTLPDFVTEEMSHRDLYTSACNLIKENFELLSVSVYLKGLQKTDLMNFVMIVHGMLDSDNHSILDNLLKLWGYYLTLQADSSAAGLWDLMEVAAENERYSSVFDKLLDTCKSLSILKSEDKKRLREMLEVKDNFRLSLLSLRYLYEIDSGTLKNVLAMDESLEENLRFSEWPSHFPVSFFRYLFNQYHDHKQIK